MNKRPLENGADRDDKGFKVPALPSKVLQKSVIFIFTFSL